MKYCACGNPAVPNSKYDRCKSCVDDAAKTGRRERQRIRRAAMIADMRAGVGPIAAVIGHLKEPKQRYDDRDARFRARTVIYKQVPVPINELIINPGIQATRIESTWPDWRKVNPDDIDPAKAKEVDRILRMRA